MRPQGPTHTHTHTGNKMEHKMSDNVSFNGPFEVSMCDIHVPSILCVCV